MTHIIKDEELTAYLEGRLSKAEISNLKKRLEENGEPDLLHHLLYSEALMPEEYEIDQEQYFSESPCFKISIPISSSSGSRILALDPMRLAAAKTDGYLCDLECEEYILLSLGYDVKRKTLLDEAYNNKWMKEKGMPIYQIGRLLEKYKLSVARKYNQYTIKDITECLEQGNKLIAVVNSEKLSQLKDIPQNIAKEKNPNHAVVILSIAIEDDTICLFDPQTGNNQDIYSLDSFIRAWNDSQNFLVVSNTRDKFEYDPQPIMVDDVELDPSLSDLEEILAENNHELWASDRKKEGWSYGPKRNDDKKENPDMRPYSDLEDSEKQYDRNMAIKTLKLVQKMGYKIVKD